jgi:hypothetical protein
MSTSTQPSASLARAKPSSSSMELLFYSFTQNLIQNNVDHNTNFHFIKDYEEFTRQYYQFINNNNEDRDQFNPIYQRLYTGLMQVITDNISGFLHTTSLDNQIRTLRLLQSFLDETYVHYGIDTLLHPLQFEKFNKTFKTIDKFYTDNNIDSLKHMSSRILFMLEKAHVTNCWKRKS